MIYIYLLKIKFLLAFFSNYFKSNKKMVIKKSQKNQL